MKAHRRIAEVRGARVAGRATITTKPSYPDFMGAVGQCLAGSASVDRAVRKIVVALRGLDPRGRSIEMKGRATPEQLRLDLHAAMSAVPDGAELGAVLRTVQRWVERHCRALEASGAREDLGRLVHADVDRYPWTKDVQVARADFLRVAGSGARPAELAMLVMRAFWEALSVVRERPCPRCDGEVELQWAFEADRLFWLCRTCTFAEPLDRGATAPRAFCVPPRHVVERDAVVRSAIDAMRRREA